MSYQQKIIKALKILADKKDFYDLLLSHGVSPKSMGDMREKLIISDNKLIVYRAIITDQIRTRSLGIYWTYDKDAAWPYDGSSSCSRRICQYASNGNCYKNVRTRNNCGTGETHIIKRN